MAAIQTVDRRLSTMYQLKLFLLLLCASLGVLASSEDECPGCVCDGANVVCSHRKLTSLPADLSDNISSLDLSHNLITFQEPNQAGLCELYPGLVNVSLASNRLSKIGHLFTGCKHLEYLDLIDNILILPNPSSFEDLESLEQLSSIEIQEFDKHIFQNLHKLVILHITLHGINVQSGIFKGLLSLKQLVLTLEKLITLPENFLTIGLGNVLSSLTINGAKVKDIPGDLLINVANLQHLHLDLPQLLKLKLQLDQKPKYIKVVEIFNVKSLSEDILFNLHYLETVKFHGIDNLAKPYLFQMANSVKNLEIKRCSLTELPRGWFTNMAALETLDLGENGLEKLSAIDFQQLTHLKQLNLSKNKIHQLPRGLFESMKSKLTQLSMFGNQLEELEPDTFSDLELLELLDLSLNTIREIAPKSFHNLARLLVLRMSGNYISSIDNIQFELLPKLYEIDLSENMISEFPESLISSKIVNFFLAANNLQYIPSKKLCSMQSLQILDVKDNPVFCDCAVRSIHKCHPQLDIRGQCSKPSQLEGVNIENVPECMPLQVSITSYINSYYNLTRSTTPLNLLLLDSAVPTQVLPPTSNVIASSDINPLKSNNMTKLILSTNKFFSNFDHASAQPSSSSPTSRLVPTLDDDDDEIVRPLMAHKISEIVTNSAENLLPTSAVLTTSDAQKNLEVTPLGIINGTFSPDMLQIAAPADTVAAVFSSDVFMLVLISMALALAAMTSVWFYKKRTQSGSYNAVTTSSVELPQRHSGGLRDQQSTITVEQDG